MVSTTYRDTLANQVSAGRISQTIIDQAVRRVLAIKFRLGLFERPLADASAFRSVMLRTDAVDLARKAACSIVRAPQERRPPAAGQIVKAHRDFGTAR